MTKLPIFIAPSILSGDFGRLADEAKRVEQAGADAIHIDVMDGNFVPNLTLGPKAVAAIRRSTSLFLDVHLMIYHPFDYVERFVEAGANRIIFHFEATEDVEETLEFIRRTNTQVGLAFCPETASSFIPKYLDKCDLILLMTVHPGFGGQDFMPEVLEKIKFTREMCDQLQIRKGGVVSSDKRLPIFDIEVDGGINDKTAPLCAQAGANVFVSGHYLFNQPDMKVSIENMRRSCLKELS